jgi:hypothetical protein
MSDLFAHAPAGELLYTFDWSADVPSGVSITQVDYTLPSPLQSFADADDFPNKRSTIGIRGVLHGATYQVHALATLSSGEKVPKTLVIRGYVSA